MSGLKESARASADRLLKPYLGALANDITSVREDVISLVIEIRDRLGAIEAHNRATTDEIRGVRGSTDLRLDHTNLRLHQVLDEVGGVRDRLERLERHLTGFEEQLEQRFSSLEERLEQRFNGMEQSFNGMEQRFNGMEEHFEHLSSGLWERWALVQEHFDNNSSTLVGYFEEQAQRQAELREGMGELGQATRQALEKLELLMMAQLEGLFGAVASEAGAVRTDLEELTRMIRMQGDASDQVAEVMGRAFNRLSAEVEVLSNIVPRDEVAPSPA
ncbi:MAG TPA: hypothetical protein VK425_10135 [Acidimicrobiales bacterium]|nr:hypothetical protein [Acidimicrobiales bacterium]